MTGTAFVVVAGLAAAGYALFHSGDSPTPRSTSAALVIAQVQKTDLSDSRTLDGTLGYGSPKTLKGARDGTITFLPGQGTILERGSEVARVDDQPVFVFYGTTPLFRDLNQVGMAGRDVRMVADNLTALGYDIGAQPAVGRLISPSPAGPADGKDPTGKATKNAKRTTHQVRVRQGDSVLTTQLKSAIGRWRHNQGLTGSVLHPGDVLILTGAARVQGRAADVGDPGIGPLLTVTSRTKHVTVEVSSTDLSEIHLHQKVAITLPSQRTVGGHVRSISPVADPQAGVDGAETPKQSVSISVDKASSIRELDAATVTVTFGVNQRKGVLAVPVGALLALSGGGYAVQPVQGPLVPVETGLFADGMVQVTGADLRAGLKVVTAS